MPATYYVRMIRVTRVWRVGIVLAITVMVGVGPLQALAVTTPSTLIEAGVSPVIVTEIQMSNRSSEGASVAGEEFVELYNATDADIDFADVSGGGQNIWKLQFFSATSTSAGTPDWAKPTTSITLAGTIPAHGYFVLASTSYTPGGLEADQAYSSRLSETGGGLQLASVAGPVTTVQDRVMWKQASLGKTLPAGVLATPVAGGSLQRQPNDDDLYVEEDGLTGFVVGDSTTPGDIWMPPVVVEPETVEEVVTTTDSGTPGEASAEEPATGTETEEIPLATDNTGLDTPFLNEVLPNPASPATDEADEYIELYNPNDEPFSLTGYSLQIGTSTLKNFTFGDGVVIPADSYKAFYSRDTRLSLTNTGNQVRLLDSHEVKVSETTAYGAAGEGQAWALAAGSWQWTTDLTPGLANVITAPATKAATKSAAKTAAAKKATAPKATKVKGTTTTKKAKAPKAPKAKKVKKVKTTNAAAISAEDEAPQAPIHTGVLVAVGVLAVLYGAYEYRHDISNRLHQLRFHRGIRGGARRQSARG